MKIEYAGPRPMISQHGVQFKDGKEDKYVYLMISIQILQAIDKNYEGHKSFSYDTSTRKFSNDEIEEILNEQSPTLGETIKKEEEILNTQSPTLGESIKKEEEYYLLKIADEIKLIKERTNLTDDEKKAWVNNLEDMQNYRIQRAVNKIYYMHSIDMIKDIIIRESIKEIDTPFDEKYWHVLQTIQGSVEAGRYSKHTSLKIDKTDDEEQMIAKLLIVI